MSWEKDSTWAPPLGALLPTVQFVNRLKILYDEHQNPLFIWLARILAKQLPRNHPKVDIKWIDEYLENVENRMLQLLSDPPKGDFAKQVAAALGFNPTPGKGTGTPASKAKTILRDEMLAAEVFKLRIRKEKEYIAIEIIARENQLSITTVGNALHSRRRSKVRS
jgi:hypothetical protein